MISSRIANTFKELAAKGRTGIVPYVTVGFPDLATTLELVPALAEAGADIIELGVPFSDPMADGTTIQNASFQALRQGVTLRGCLEMCASLRERGLETPLVLMGYYNPILAFGLERFAEEAQNTGVDGVIVPDLPPGEAGPLRERCEGRGIDVICLLAPTSTDGRIQAACATATAATIRKIWRTCTSARAAKALATKLNAVFWWAPTPCRRATTTPTTSRPRRCVPS